MIYLSSTNGNVNREYIKQSLQRFGIKPKRRRRVPRPKFPRRAERNYLRAMLALLDESYDLINQLIDDELPVILDEAAREIPFTDSVSLDAWGKRVFDLIELIRATLLGFSTDETLISIVEDVGDEVNALNDRQHKRLVQTVLGVDVLASEPWLVGQMEAFTASNVSLIKGLNDQYVGEIQRIIFDGARQGLRHEVIAQQLRERAHLGVEKRAAFIARNQVAKFNAALSQARNKQMGIDGYFWRGVLDERERQSHVRREGERFSYSEPPEDGHPGEPYNCRCVEEPDMTPFFDGEAA